ncbi:MAG: SsrA-binding protein [Candidatus Vogelbacteria bacterium CG10_big_fil_rev_8_21_14_0_10_45_14]|uniref:SsrA-binding protein n=1 Tax=Candidatus Vogelbacteria bacterium CG10_big_fil_rev_8_21_14_0_10_45_14 TaxID=1975042 RepID=A0A2H0RJY0_9BACT|nr:MAG: SsrA-binding protein [Candidatus Vogelbacteria bacterium CG10_big_fil_rev_8_21_14_0_10_45_14]
MSLLENKKATFNYEILDKYEAGLELLGQEVKSLRLGHGSLSGSYVTIRKGEMFLVGATIPPFQPKNAPDGYDDKGDRRLLVKKRELKYLIGKTDERGLTLIPLSVYNKGRFIKLSFALAKGKKKHDKRSTIKEREDRRHIDRLKHQRRGL